MFAVLSLLLGQTKTTSGCASDKQDIVHLVLDLLTDSTTGHLWSCFLYSGSLFSVHRLSPDCRDSEVDPCPTPENDSRK